MLLGLWNAHIWSEYTVDLRTGHFAELYRRKIRKLSKSNDEEKLKTFVDIAEQSPAETKEEVKEIINLAKQDITPQVMERINANILIMLGKLENLTNSYFLQKKQNEMEEEELLLMLI